ncbi:MAG: hypothetical protein PHE73_03445 [Sulfurovaceae bacterium]|nr:hypothetical protein [Sulfurovaceae bacterium]
MIFKENYTGRGFKFLDFHDFNDRECSLQISSLATEKAIWLGIDNPRPKILASDAEKLGVKTTEHCGWIDYPLPEEVLLATRMHLTTDQVRSLIVVLKQFIDEMDQ